MMPHNIFIQRARNLLTLFHDLFYIKTSSRKYGNNLDDLIRLILETPRFRPSQQFSEIRRLLEIVQKNNFRTIAEIGNYKGGSLFLLSQVAGNNAQLISIDINYPIKSKIINKIFVKPRQRVICIRGDSANAKTFLKVKNALRGEELDLIFIDGDHSYEGVKSDFELYSTLVRKGGVIALHDIHPDFFLMHGKKTRSFVGGVPFFWKQIKENYPDTEEIIEDIHQDGFGMGIIYKN